MSTTFELYLAGAGERYLEQAARAARDELVRLEEVLSRFVPHSDIAQINRLKPGEYLRVSAETAECLQLASELSIQTGGAFDIAFRSRRGPGRVGAGVPPLVFDPVEHAVGVQMAGLVLDLGGLGKGYAIDRIIALLGRWKVPSALVHGGQSTVYALGRAPEGGEWKVGLRAPDRPARSFGTLTLSDCAVSGSGQSPAAEHIFDPRTARPASGVRAAWAVAGTAAVADALSTAFMVMNAEEVARFCGRRPDASAILWPAGADESGVRRFGPRAAFTPIGRVGT